MFSFNVQLYKWCEKNVLYWLNLYLMRLNFFIIGGLPFNGAFYESNVFDMRKLWSRVRVRAKRHHPQLASTAVKCQRFKPIIINCLIRPSWGHLFILPLMFMHNWLCSTQNFAPSGVWAPRRQMPNVKRNPNR